MSSTIFSDPQLLAELNKHSRIKTYEKDEVFINPGDDIVFLPIVLKGCLRIIRQAEDGREVFLYHLYPGQTCAMSLNCCQSGKKSMIKAIVEDKADILLVTVKETENWFIYPEWKAFVSSNYANRFEELIQVIDLIAFSHMDAQLLHYLQERAKALNTKKLDITHQQIADELHTHREAVSRLLRLMENKKLVKLGRNNIELLEA